MQTLRPGQRILNIPGIGVTTSRRAVQVAVAAGWWLVAGKTCEAAYLAKDAASYAASKVNLNTPGTYDAINGTAHPTWDATGWAFDGISQCLNCGGLIVQGAWTTIIRFSDGPTDNAWRCLIGAQTNASNRLEIWPKSDGFMWIANASSPSFTAATGGVIAVAGATAYYNGSALTGNLGGAWTSGTKPLYVGCRYNINAPSDFIPAKVQALAIYSDTLTAGEVATVSAAMAAL